MRIKIPAYYYQQFDADYSRDVPAEGFSGWKKASLKIETKRTALVVMHAWDCGTYQKYPGWCRSVDFIPRAQKICRDIFPKLLKAARASPIPVFHVASSAHYCKKYPGYKKVAALAGEEKSQSRLKRLNRIFHIKNCSNFRPRIALSEREIVRT